MMAAIPPVPGSNLPFTRVLTTYSGPNDIPAMTDPLGHHWSQPADIRDAAMDGEYIWLTARQIRELSVYDSSYPSGRYDGKCWLRSGPGDVRWLCWYHPHPTPGKSGIDHRTIIEL
jgi:hypothetical protein